jgi:hypothetical protein
VLDRLRSFDAKSAAVSVRSLPTPNADLCIDSEDEDERGDESGSDDAGSGGEDRGAASARGVHWQSVRHVPRALYFFQSCVLKRYFVWLLSASAS